jgi:hypothetical protein
MDMPPKPWNIVLPTIGVLAKRFLDEHGDSLGRVLQTPDFVWTLTSPSLQHLFFALLRFCGVEEYAFNAESLQIFWMGCADAGLPGSDKLSAANVGVADAEKFAKCGALLGSIFDVLVPHLAGCGQFNLSDTAVEEFQRTFATVFGKAVVCFREEYPAGYSGSPLWHTMTKSICRRIRRFLRSNGYKISSKQSEADIEMRLHDLVHNTTDAAVRAEADMWQGRLAIVSGVYHLVLDALVDDKHELRQSLVGCVELEEEKVRLRAGAEQCRVYMQLVSPISIMRLCHVHRKHLGCPQYFLGVSKTYEMVHDLFGSVIDANVSAFGRNKVWMMYSAACGKLADKEFCGVCLDFLRMYELIVSKLAGNIVLVNLNYFIPAKEYLLSFEAILTRYMAQNVDELERFLKVSKLFVDPLQINCIEYSPN